MIHGGQVTELLAVFGYMIWYAVLIDAKLDGRRTESWPRVLVIPLLVTLKFAIILGIIIVIRWLLSGRQHAAAMRERQHQQYLADLHAQAMYQQYGRWQP